MEKGKLGGSLWAAVPQGLDPGLRLLEKGSLGGSLWAAVPQGLDPGLRLLARKNKSTTSSPTAREVNGAEELFTLEHKRRAHEPAAVCALEREGRREASGVMWSLLAPSGAELAVEQATEGSTCGLLWARRAEGTASWSTPGAGEANREES